MEMDVLTMILSFILTGIFYSSLPIIVSAVRKNPISKKKHLLFVIICSIAVYFIFFLIYMIQGEDMIPKITALIIWGNVSYYVGLAILKKRHKLQKIDAFSAVTVSEKHTDTYEVCYCHKCGNKLEPDSRFCSKCGAKIGGLE